MFYPHFIQWKMDLESVSDFSQLVSKEKIKRILKGFTLLFQSNYQLVTEKVDEQYFTKFLPLYQQFVKAKKHGTVFDVRGKIAANQAQGIEYESISLTKSDTLIGGLIYSVRPTTLNVAYRVFPHLLKIKLPIAISYLGEYLLVKRAIELGKKMIIHGKDRNPYGPNSAIGLADYKLRIGCQPFVSGSSDNTFRDLKELQHNLHEDTLVFLGDTPDQPITEGILFTNLDQVTTQQNYASVLNKSAVRVTRVAASI